MSEGKQLITTRRGFLATAGMAAAGAVLSQTAASAQRVIGANDRINYGLIGCGPQGMASARAVMELAAAGQANAALVAVCDIWDKRKEGARDECKAKLYHDYHELLADQEIDVVVIATPEHLHALMAIDAFAAGKDVYLEKPMARYLDDAVKVYRAAVASKRVLQVGSQWASDAKWAAAHKLLPEIGHPVWSQTGYCRNSLDGEWNYPIDSSANEQNLDWKRWLGPAPEVPFSLDRYFRWRKYWDYSGGIAGDLFPHRVYPLLIVLGPQYPTRVVATGGTYVQKDREVPDTFHMLADFPNGHTMFVAGCTANEQTPSPMIRGHEATMYLSGGTQIDIRPERIYTEDMERIREKVEPVGDFMQAHHLNFMHCVRTREEPNCGPSVALPGMVVVALAEDSYRHNKVYGFDAEKLQAVVL